MTWRAVEDIRPKGHPHAVTSLSVFAMLPLIVLGLGVLLHVAYFIHGEHHVHGILYLRMLASFLAIVTLVLWRFGNQALASSFVTALAIEGQFILGLFSSIVTYRVLPMHRLHRYPGPLTWRISKLAHAWSNRDFENFQNLHASHEKYGDYVRTGPSELSIIDPDAILAVLGSSSKCTRAAWYGMAHPIRAIFHTRSKVEHEKRRQVWAPGLSTKALRAYQPRMESNIASLVQQIDRYSAECGTVNVSRWFNYLSFDVMGDVGFGKNFGMLDKGEKVEVLKKLEDGQKGLGIFGVVPWLFMILTKIPSIRKEHDVFVEWCAKQILDRREVICIPFHEACQLTRVIEEDRSNRCCFRTDRGRQSRWQLRKLSTMAHRRQPYLDRCRQRCNSFITRFCLLPSRTRRATCRRNQKRAGKYRSSEWLGCFNTTDPSNLPERFHRGGATPLAAQPFRCAKTDAEGRLGDR
jgi:hypothetical protein